MRNGTGYYRYASVEDFLNQAAPRDFALTYGYDGELNPTAEVAFNQLGFYIQDDWDVNSKFKLSYGIRADYLRYEDNILRNNAIFDLSYGGRNIDTGKWPEANILFSPRVGFSWDIKEDQSLKLRGGTGIFTGLGNLLHFQAGNPRKFTLRPFQGNSPNRPNQSRRCLGEIPGIPKANPAKPGT